MFRLHVHLRGAFTIIELLVVVAIIAMLASIAMVNYQGSVARARTSRALADMRSLATALEAYYVDNNDYPPNPAIPLLSGRDRQSRSPHQPRGFNITPFHLTTPVGYFTMIPRDPFREGLRNVYDIYYSEYDKERYFYSYYRIIPRGEWLAAAARGGAEISLIAVDAARPQSQGPGDRFDLYRYLNRGAFEKYGEWVQWAAGPDGVLWRPNDDFVIPGDPLNALREPLHPPWGYSFDIPYDPTNGTMSFGNIIRTQLGKQQYGPSAIWGAVPPEGAARDRGDAANQRQPPMTAGVSPDAGRDAGGDAEAAALRERETREFERAIEQHPATEPFAHRPWWAFIFLLPGWLWLLLLLVLLLLLLAGLVWYLTRRRRLENRIAMISSTLSDSDLLRIRGIKTLRRLHLAQSQVTDDGLRHIAGSPALESLNLWGSLVTSAGMEALQTLPRLRELVLSDTAVADAGLPALASLPALENLVLTGLPITDAGLFHLRGIKTLRYLNVRSTRVTIGGVEAFQKANPQCEVVHSLEMPSRPLGGNARRHKKSQP